MNTSTYYNAEKISQYVTKITSLTREVLYLVEGSYKAVLIDSGLGVGHLRDFVMGLTKKPVTVILTHGHVDHAMGASEFADVYMNSADLKVFRRQNNLKFRKEYMKVVCRDSQILPDDSEYTPSIEPCFQELNEGDRFELGGITLEIFSAKGHTPGSMAVLFKEERKLLLGDACSYTTFLFVEDSLTVEEYKKSMEKLNMHTKDSYDQVYLSHGAGGAPGTMLESAIEVCQNILDGSADDIPYQFMEFSGLIAKKVDSSMKRMDGGISNIIYHKDKVFM